MSLLERTALTTMAETCLLRRLGIDTGDERVLFLRSDSPICQSEGFSPRARIQVHVGGRDLVTMLDVVHGDLLATDEAGLSEAAWCELAPKPGDRASFSHAPSVESLGLIRRKIHGHELDDEQFDTIMADMVKHRYSSVELAAFVSACSGGRLSQREVVSLTRSMVAGGARLHWTRHIVVDKHCIGGLPGNRTTLIVVPILTSLGMLMPKTSSRAITSPAGTADTMETLAPVNLDVLSMQRVVERTGGCVVWGQSAHLSPADDVLIRIERMLDVESEGQLVASVLSKKVAAGASHVIVDIPVGPTAKVRTPGEAQALCALMTKVADAFGVRVRPLVTDGTAPVGRGIGPALEAHDVLAVLRGEHLCPRDLRERALYLAAQLYAFANDLEDDQKALRIVTHALDSGAAWSQFVTICEEQGGMRTPGKAAYQQPIEATAQGVVGIIDNRRLAKVAKLAGAPHVPLAGVALETRPGQTVSRHDPLFVIHAETKGQLAYAMAYVAEHPGIVEVKYS
ncbi:thymidine phosphorylase family protein [Dyella japonica]|uniref:Putative thymidine phosphorylase n=1 Tax=Dyella japonica TaxID=231455 RepID=A0ABV2JP76_9GAMM